MQFEEFRRLLLPVGLSVRVCLKMFVFYSHFDFFLAKDLDFTKFEVLFCSQHQTKV